PTAWHGQNLREILMTLGYDVDTPWRDLPKKDRDWILFTDEQPTVPVYSGFDAAEVRAALKRKMAPSYQGTFTGAKRYVMQTFATTQSALMKKRVAQYMVSHDCPLCRGKRLQRASLSVKFAGYDITEISRLPLKKLAAVVEPYTKLGAGKSAAEQKAHPEKAIVTQRIACDLLGRLGVLLDLGLGYLQLERSTPTLSPGELQRLRLATQVRSNLFGVVYVLDEPSAGLHPADTQALLTALAKLRQGGNSLFVVEHDLDVIERADWIVDVGPAAGVKGGTILYSGPPEGLRKIEESQTRRYLFAAEKPPLRTPRAPQRWLQLKGVTRNNLDKVDCAFPLAVMTSVTGVSGSGKSSLVSQALVELVARHLGHEPEAEEDEVDALERTVAAPTGGKIAGGMEHIRRLVRVDQKPIGRTPRSNLATYTGLFDHVRKLFAATKAARAKRYDAGRFSFNVAKGRCPTCEGEGQVMVELLFLPSVYTPCPTCQGARYNPGTLAIEFNGKNIADVLAMTVDDAWTFFADELSLQRPLGVLREVGLGYLRLGQSATELSGGEAQRVKLATELQRPQRGDTLYILDEPTTGLHPSDIDKLIAQLERLVEAGNTVILVEHDMRVVAASDWVVDIGPGAGDEGGQVVASGPPADVARVRASRTAPFLKQVLP
ncbi:MAG TPA: excinuclease ABC subunit UvrA, partial [Burkholderiaceae bacterium]